jgi:hypothetical protein
MLRTKLALFAFAPAFALGLLSCAVDPVIEEEETIVEDEATIVAPDRDLYGTFRAPVTLPGQMPVLVLMSDGTYHRVIRMPCSTAGPCVPAEDNGQFVIHAREGVNYLTLSSHTGAVGRYAYVLMGDTLRLRVVGERDFVSMTKTPEAAWCGEMHDCGVQNLQGGSCAGVWSCWTSVCTYNCWAPLPIQEPILDLDNGK